MEHKKEGLDIAILGRINVYQNRTLPVSLTNYFVHTVFTTICKSVYYKKGILLALLCHTLFIKKFRAVYTNGIIQI